MSPHPMCAACLYYRPPQPSAVQLGTCLDVAKQIRRADGTLRPMPTVAPDSWCHCFTPSIEVSAPRYLMPPPDLSRAALQPEARIQDMVDRGATYQEIMAARQKLGITSNVIYDDCLAESVPGGAFRPEFEAKNPHPNVVSLAARKSKKGLTPQR